MIQSRRQREVDLRNHAKVANENPPGVIRRISSALIQRTSLGQSVRKNCRRIESANTRL